MCGLLMRLLRSKGLRVGAATRGLDRCACATGRHPSSGTVIIHDILVPIHRGQETIGRLRASGLLVPVLFMLSSADLVVMHDAHAIGCVLSAARAAVGECPLLLG